MYIIDKTNRSRTIRHSRESDYHELLKEAQTNPDPAARRLAQRAIHDIKTESKSVRGMREALVKAHRRGDSDEVKDIHDIVANEKKYRYE